MPDPHGLRLGTGLAVTLDGAPLPRALASRVSLCVVRQVLGAPAVAELDLADPPPGELGAVTHGQALGLALADGRPLFQGAISGIEHEHDGAGGLVLRLRARDALEAARQRRRVRVLENVTPGDLARQLAGELGLEAVVAIEGPRRGRLIQAGVSDLALLVEFAGAAGLHPVLREGRLLLTGLDGEGEELPLRLGRGLHRLRMSSGSERALARAEARGWDPRSLRVHARTVGLARQDAQEMHEAGLGALAAPPALPLAGRLFEGPEEAEGLAQAALDTATAASVTAEGLAEGDPALAPGRPIRLEGTAGPLGEGRHVPTRVLHRFDAATGYLVEFDTLPPEPSPALGPVLLAGVVADAADPEGQGRCRLSLDALGEAETGWLPVLVPGAGAGKGLAALPEEGDTVLAVFPDGAFDRGVVLGGLWGEQRLPRGLGARRQRPVVLRTPGGQTVTLGAANGTLRVENAAGSRLELAPGRVRLSAATDLVIEAPGQTLTLRAKAIEMEQG